jgi:protein TonB
METYLREEAGKVNSREEGSVRLSFRVTPNSTITDIKVEKGLSKELNEQAKEILLKGPRWLPAHNHGYIAIDGFGFVTIDFTSKQ